MDRAVVVSLCALLASSAAHAAPDPLKLFPDSRMVSTPRFSVEIVAWTAKHFVMCDDAKTFDATLDAFLKN